MPTPSQSEQTGEIMETITLKVGGMTCQGCVRSVKKVLEAVPGVRNADVSLEEAQAKVELHPGHAASDQDTLTSLKQAVEAAGYEAA
jgi:copper chaperone